MTTDTRMPADDGTRIGRLGAANLLGPLAVLAGLEAAYALADRACRTGDMLPVHLACAITLGLALAAGVLGWREWRRWPAADGVPATTRASRSRFLALLGVLISALSALVLMAQWSATLFFRPCQ